MGKEICNLLGRQSGPNITILPIQLAVISQFSFKLASVHMHDQIFVILDFNDIAFRIFSSIPFDKAVANFTQFPKAFSTRLFSIPLGLLIKSGGLLLPDRLHGFALMPCVSCRYDIRGGFDYLVFWDALERSRGRGSASALCFRHLLLPGPQLLFPLLERLRLLSLAGSLAPSLRLNIGNVMDGLARVLYVLELLAKARVASIETQHILSSLLLFSLSLLPPHLLLLLALGKELQLLFEDPSFNDLFLLFGTLPRIFAFLLSFPQGGGTWQNVQLHQRWRENQLISFLSRRAGRTS